MDDVHCIFDCFEEKLVFFLPKKFIEIYLLFDFSTNLHYFTKEFLTRA